jgi:hypothetical protein
MTPRMLLLSPALVLAAFAATASAEAALPPAVEAIIAGYADQCRQLGGKLQPGADRPKVMTADFDGDGKPDYLLDPENMRCSAAATAFCGNGGCQISIALSSDGYRTPVSVLGGAPKIVKEAGGTNVEVWVDDVNCNVADRDKACWATYSWKHGNASTTYHTEPRPR